MMIVLIGQLNSDAGTVDAVLSHSLGAEPVSAKSELAQLGAELLNGKAGIDQRAEGHVSACPGEWIEQGYFHALLLRCRTLLPGAYSVS